VSNKTATSSKDTVLEYMVGIARNHNRIQSSVESADKIYETDESRFYASFPDLAFSISCFCWKSELCNLVEPEANYK